MWREVTVKERLLASFPVGLLVLVESVLVAHCPIPSKPHSCYGCPQISDREREREREREQNIKFLRIKLMFTVEPCSCEHRRHGSLTRGTKETRAEMPRKVLLQVGLWVAPEWVGEDIEGDLQFLAEPDTDSLLMDTKKRNN